ncbi:hypothetical protein BKA82DRAFT_4014379 [Pisolithus tinctorius]|nr:hypothetical protein BKA82DRAFT_4014379 [Pisolithus tinctorius]
MSSNGFLVILDLGDRHREQKCLVRTVITGVTIMSSNGFLVVLDHGDRHREQKCLVRTTITGVTNMSSNGFLVILDLGDRHREQKLPVITGVTIMSSNGFLVVLDHGDRHRAAEVPVITGVTNMSSNGFLVVLDWGTGIGSRSAWSGLVMTVITGVTIMSSNGFLVVLDHGDRHREQKCLVRTSHDRGIRVNRLRMSSASDSWVMTGWSMRSFLQARYPREPSGKARGRTRVNSFPEKAVLTGRMGHPSWIRRIGIWYSTVLIASRGNESSWTSQVIGDTGDMVAQLPAHYYEHLQAFFWREKAIRLVFTQIVREAKSTKRDARVPDWRSPTFDNYILIEYHRWSGSIGGRTTTTSHAEHEDINWHAHEDTLGEIWYGSATQFKMEEKDKTLDVAHRLLDVMVEFYDPVVEEDPDSLGGGRGSETAQEAHAGPRVFKRVNKKGPVLPDDEEV